ncbi:MAG TPA: NAD(P)-binding domain-containing protein, partial [Chloroflexota bacterium]|nr:NAD(P)-binding domain-containing protein [Chloroflexota bacterium]
MRIGIVGLGLIGGSLAGALRRAGHEVIGWDRDQVTRNAAVER